MVGWLIPVVLWREGRIVVAILMASESSSWGVKAWAFVVTTSGTLAVSLHCVIAG